MDWKERSKKYHSKFPDTIKNRYSDIYEYEAGDPAIEMQAVAYALVDSRKLYYPAKTYAMATTYAILLAKHFGGDPINYLRDPDLLGSNDPWYKTYDEKPIVYDYLIEVYSYLFSTTNYKISEGLKQIIKSFEEEFLLADDTKDLLDNKTTQGE